MDQPAKQIENSPKEPKDDAKMADETPAAEANATDKPDASVETPVLGLASGEANSSKVAPPVNIGVHIPQKPEEQAKR